MPRYLAAVLTLAALAWCAVVVTAPLSIAHRWPYAASLAAGVYHGAGRICHQRPERSFHAAGVPYPVCARCFGLYASGAAGALLGWTALAGFRRRPRDRWLLLAAAVPTALTFTLEFAGIMAFSNSARFAAALPLGLAAGWLFVGVLLDEARHSSASAVPLRG